MLSAIQDRMIQVARTSGLAVVIVEDEWLIRTTAAQALSGAGFCVSRGCFCVTGASGPPHGSGW